MLKIKYTQWTLTRMKSTSIVARDGTHHINSQGMALYTHRFHKVMAFHEVDHDELAAVVDSTGAYHINTLGAQQYSQRFDHSHGFYCGLAAVSVKNQWFHVRTSGESAYLSRWSWCGNFHRVSGELGSARCPVRESADFYHINECGNIVGGPYSYAGDFNSHGTAVIWDRSGSTQLVDYNGKPVTTVKGHSKVLEIRNQHKGVAAARDDNGWYFLDLYNQREFKSNVAKRFAEVEDFYNGVARVRLLNGDVCLISEYDGDLILPLPSSQSEIASQLTKRALGYWPALSLKMVIESNILNDLANNEPLSNDPFIQRLITEAISSGFILQRSDQSYEITSRGTALITEIVADRCRYWLQDRYLRAWLPSLCTSLKSPGIDGQTDAFQELANDPQGLRLSHRVLESYAKQDWAGISTHLQIAAEQGQITTLVDLGGGSGQLLREVERSYAEHIRNGNLKLILMDRPEVLALLPDLKFDGIEKCPGDLFAGPLPSGENTIYVMSRVLHDWSDDRAREILRRIREQSPIRCVVIDRISESRNPHSLLSLHMHLLQAGAYERNESEWSALFSSAGWFCETKSEHNEHIVFTLIPSTKMTDEANTPRRVRKAVIPMAGRASRMLPQSLVLPKALLPIVQENTRQEVIIQPALQLILQELLGACIDEIYIIVAPDHIPIVVPYLRSLRLLSPENSLISDSSMGNTSQTWDYKEKFLDNRVVVVIQERPLGLGHAILQAKDFVAGSPFVLALGDHIYSRGCCKQLLASYYQLIEQSKGSVDFAMTGVGICSLEEAPLTGLIRLQPFESNKRNIALVADMVEKPQDFSKLDAFRATTSDRCDQYLCQLGLDVLPPTLFPILESEMVSIVAAQESRELDLRAVMKKYLLNQNLLAGAIVEGRRHDIGTPATYKDTLRFWMSRKSSTLPPTSWEIVQWLEDHHKSLRLPSSLVTNLLFGSKDLPLHAASSPGRLDILGGIADYSGSHCIQLPINQRTYCFIRSNSLASNREQVNIASVLVDDSACGKLMSRYVSCPVRWFFTDDQSSIASSELLSSRIDEFISTHPEHDWIKLLVGVIHAAASAADYPHAQNVLSKGLSLALVSNIPVGTGLASSAACSMSAISCLHKIFASQQTAENDDLPKMVHLCQMSENKIVGTASGPMDQLAVAYAKENNFVAFNCMGSPSVTDRKISYLEVPRQVQVFAVQSGIARRLTDPTSSYNQVWTATMIGKELINKLRRDQMLGPPITQLCEVSLQEFESVYKPLLPVSWTRDDFDSTHGMQLPTVNSDDSCRNYPVLACTAHAIEEHDRALEMTRLLSLGNYDRDNFNGIRKLLKASQLSYQSMGLSTSEIDELERLLDDTFGESVACRLSGGGRGGALTVMYMQNNETSSRDDTINRFTTAFHERVQPKYHQTTGRTTTAMSVFPRVSSRIDFGGVKYHGAIRWMSTTAVARRPRVMLVNHGYPPAFNGGSEVYTQTLAEYFHLSGRFEEVTVIAREHDPFTPDFRVRRTVSAGHSGLPIYLMNMAREAPYMRLAYTPLDNEFKILLQTLKPDVVHFQHLNHLSVNFPTLAKEAGARVIFTLHDFWLQCPRGQFLVNGMTSEEPWTACNGQEDRKCAQLCYASRYSTGNIEAEAELKYWSQFIGWRMDAIRQVVDNVDIFLAPSTHMLQRMIDQDATLSLPESKVKYLPYGFDLKRLRNRQRRPMPHLASAENPIVFGFIGRHVPAKGLHLLVQAVGNLLHERPDLKNTFQMHIYGRTEGNSQYGLQRLIEDMDNLTAGGRPLAETIVWKPEYANDDIVNAVFNHVDCIIVPSIWDENSPMVIQKAQQCQVPVITSDHGGMGELVKDRVNGLTFHHRDASSLTRTMIKAIEQPRGLEELGKRGVLESVDGKVQSMSRHVAQLDQIFRELFESSGLRLEGAGVVPKSIVPLPSPWRVTFDTNPDDCNFKCTMCEQHSEFSPHQRHRKAANIRRRRMDINIVRKVVAELAPLGQLREIIPTTMGEPLQYKDFPTFIDLCHEYNIKLNLTTNGSFYGRGVDEWARLLVPVCSDVKISWNGASEATQQKIMRGSVMSKQLSNLHRFVAIRDEYVAAAASNNRCSVTLQVTFMEQNLNELPDIVNLAIAHNCDRVKGHHLWSHFEEIKDQDLRRDSSSIARWNAVAEQCRQIADKTRLPSGLAIKLDNFFDLPLGGEISGTYTVNSDRKGIRGELIHPEAVCPFLGNEAWINHEGRFDPCCAPDDQRKLLGSFGHITSGLDQASTDGDGMDGPRGIMDIWHSEKYQELVQNYNKLPLCRGCNMRRVPLK